MVKFSKSQIPKEIQLSRLTHVFSKAQIVKAMPLCYCGTAKYQSVLQTKTKCA